jgi:hypothetical protein
MEKLPVSHVSRKMACQKLLGWDSPVQAMVSVNPVAKNPAKGPRNRRFGFWGFLQNSTVVALLKTIEVFEDERFPCWARDSAVYCETLQDVL